MQHDGLCRLWMYCLMRASWKDGEWLIPGTTTAVKVKRGQFVTGRETLHEAMFGKNYKGEHRPASRTVWRWLESLRDMKCLRVQTVSNRASLVTVVNYDTYQTSRPKPCPSGVQLVSTVEERKKTFDSGKSIRWDEKTKDLVIPDAARIAEAFPPKSDGDWLQCFRISHLVNVEGLPAVWMDTAIAECARSNADRHHAWLLDWLTREAPKYRIENFKSRFLATRVDTDVLNEMKSYGEAAYG